MNYIPKVDKELVVKAKQHDEQAIADIINLVDRPCHTIAMEYTFSYGLSSADADDIAQEAYLKAFQKLDSLNNEDGFSAWLNIIVNNTAKDFLKKKEIKHKDAKFSELDNEDFNESFESTLENDYAAFEPKANMDYTLLQEGMQDCLNQLPAHEKSALYKFYFEHQKIGEIADEMEANQNTIKTWLSRGKKNLESVLLALQEKDAAFYGIGAIPFFVWMLNKELDASCVIKAAEVAKVIVKATTTDTITKGSALKAFLASTKGKAIATTIVLTMVAGGVGIYSYYSHQTTEKPKVAQKLTKKKKVDTIKEETKTEAPKETESEHTHTWQTQYKTVHHDAVKQAQTVVDQEAYDEPVYSTRTTTRYWVNDRVFSTQEEANAYSEWLRSLGVIKGSTYNEPVEEQYQSGTIHHDAVTHQEEVVVQNAYDEQVLTGYKCTECGQKK